MWISASGPASPVLRWFGRRVGGLGPGLTSYSADAVFGLSCDRFVGRVPRFSGTHRRAGLICLAWEEAGVHRIRRPAGACHLFNQRKEMAMSNVETRAIPGGVDTHADTHVAAALDPVGGLLGVREFPVTAAGYASLLGWLGGFGTVCLAGRGHRQLRRRPGPPPVRRWRAGRRGRPLGPAGPPPPGQVRPPRPGQRRPGPPDRP